jgi:hypothetical protein
MNEKEKKLLRLMAKIHLECFKMETRFKTAWFYPEYKGVKGYLGTSRLIVVGINPSYGRFPSTPVIFFYDCLREFKLQNLHVTDIIKSRLSNSLYVELKRNKELFDEILKKNIKWLTQEMKIIDKNLDVRIIGISREGRDILKRHFKEKVIDMWLHHYAWIERYGEENRIERRKIFKKEIQKIKKDFSNYY